MVNTIELYVVCIPDIIHYTFIVSTGLVTGLSITTILMILSIIINIILILFIVVTYKKSKVHHTKYNYCNLKDITCIIYYIVSKKEDSGNIVMMTSPAYDVFKTTQ